MKETERKKEVTQRFLEAMTCVIETHQLPNQKGFADHIGVGNYLISNLNNGKSQVNAWMIAAMVDKYPEISPDYVLNGRGELVRETEVLFDTTKKMWDYIESLQDENSLQKKQIEYLQSLLLEERAKARSKS